MKRGDLVRHLRASGCVILREGGAHTVWVGPDGTRESAVPRHSEIKNVVVRKICRDFGIAMPQRG